MKFKFSLGDRVVVPYLGTDVHGGDLIGSVGEIESLRVNRDKSVRVLVRWGAYGVIHAKWFTEKELRMAKKEKAAIAHPKKKPAPKKKPVKKKTTRRRAQSGGNYPASG